MTVYKAYFEVIGDEERALCKEHFASKQEAKNACFAIAKDLGAKSYFPGVYGGIRGIAFDAVPTGWRKIRCDGTAYCCIPKKNSNAGREALERIQLAPKGPQEVDLAQAIGFPGDAMFVLDDRRLYQPHFMEITRPVERRFLVIGWNTEWTIPAGAAEISLGELQRAIDAHNAGEQVPA